MVDAKKAQKGQKRKAQKEVFEQSPKRKSKENSRMPKVQEVVGGKKHQKNEKPQKNGKAQKVQKQKPQEKKKPINDLGAKFKAQKEMLAQHAKRNRKVSEVDEKLFAENENRLQDQKKRSIYVGLQGKLHKVSDSAIKALHPDILNVNRISHAAFLVFASEAVRDKAFPIIGKAKLNNTPLTIDYCCGKAKNKSAKPQSYFANKGLNLSQLVVSDLPSATTPSMLEIVFPKANDIKIIKQRHMAYINFNEESDALEAFKKGKGLKISSVPVVVRFRFAEFEKSNGTENKKLKVVDMDVDSPKKAKSAKNEVETAQKAKEMLKRGEIKPMLSKEELDNAVPLAGSDESDADLMDSDEAEDGEFEEIDVGESDFEGSTDEEQTFDAELITKGGKLQISSLKSKPTDKKEVKEVTKASAKELAKPDTKKKPVLVESSDDDSEGDEDLDELMEDGFDGIEDLEEDELDGEDSEESDDE